MYRLPLITALLCAAAPAHAAPRPTLTIAASVDGAPAADGAVQARLGQAVTLYAVVRAGRAYYTAAPSLALQGRSVPRRQLRPLSELPELLGDDPKAPLRFAWSLVEPHPHHVKLEPANEGNPAYSNAVLFGPRHGTWLGYDRIEYYETPLSSETGPTLTVRRATPTHPKVNVHGGLGTMRYRVTLRIGSSDQVLSSPGMETAGVRGISPAVTRVSFRSRDDLVGYLTTYFNVPNVFGSGGDGRTHQAELYQGADCADVITGAARMAGAAVPYTSVLGLRRLTTVVSERLLLNEKGVFYADGERRGQAAMLRFVAAGERAPCAPWRSPEKGRTGTSCAPSPGDVQAGDIMLIDYVGFTDSPRSWDHVAVLSEDRGVKGRLDPLDLIMHEGYLYGLTEEPAKDESPTVVQFLRFRPAVLKAIERRQRRQSLKLSVQRTHVAPL